MLQAAASAAGGQQYPAATLYVVATPIGNLADISLRAIHVLALVDAVACEDTRHSAPLLRLYGIDKPLIALHEHNEREAAGAVLHRLALGERVAYVSDAGTPAVSDPGAVLVAATRAAGYRVIPLPGPSSALAALSAAGDDSAGAFTVVGFLPSKGAARTSALQGVASRAETVILFEAPHRIETLAKALAATCPDRTVTIGRELTKQFESLDSMTAGAMPAWLAADANRLRGEFVLVLHALVASEAAPSASAHDRTLRVLLGALPLSQAVAIAVSLTDTPRNVLYPLALAMKADSTDDAAKATGAEDGEDDTADRA